MMRPAVHASSFTASIAAVLAMCLGAAACGDPDQTASAVEVPPEPIVFVSSAGDSVEAERGELWVPENRNSPDSRAISLAYVRFSSTSPNPGPPIVYLAGGPGGSGIATARGPRFPLFMALREIADVIAFDQRGTGDSNHIPVCETEHRLPLDAAPKIEDAVGLYERAAGDCMDFWAGEGVDIAGYTTEQSARDLESLRLALDTDRISLWGISYGTHLAMAAMKQMGSRIERAIFASAEGLDQTVKMPARTDAYFDRLQAAIDRDPAAAAAYPDVKGMIRRVLDRLRERPVVVTIPAGEGAPGEDEFTMGATEVQLLSGFMINDPANAAWLLGLYAAADDGDHVRMGGAVWGAIRRDRVSLTGMSEAMDVASGISDGAYERWREQAPESLLGGLLNFPMPWLRDAFGGLDLGPDFREGPRTETPTLLLSGTLDGRTYPESQLEATAGFRSLTHVVVENAGHNLFMVSPEVTDVILAFMRGEPIERSRIVIDLPDFGG